MAGGGGRSTTAAQHKLAYNREPPTNFGLIAIAGSRGRATGAIGRSVVMAAKQARCAPAPLPASDDADDGRRKGRGGDVPFSAESEPAGGRTRRLSW